MIVDSTGIYNKAGSKYTPIVQGDAIRFKVPQDIEGGLKAWSSLREQCGEFVNDIIGKRGFMSDLFSDKMKKVTSTLPIVGAAFVQSTKNQYGHTGMVEKVNTNELGVPVSMEIVDSNAKGNGKIERATIAITYDANGNATYTRNGKRVDIKGFTDSVLGSPTKQFSQLSSGAIIGKNISGVGQVTPEISAWADTVSKDPEKISSVPSEIRSQVNMVANQKRGVVQSTQPVFKTQEQAKNYGYGNRLMQSEDVLKTVLPSITQMNTADWVFQKSLPNWMPGKRADIKQYEQAVLNFVNAKLRQESGAAISDPEYVKAEQQYFPQPGDDPQTIKNKEANRKLVMDELFMSSGNPMPQGGSSGGGYVTDEQFKNLLNDL